MLGEHVAELRFRGVEREIADVQFHRDASKLPERVIRCLNSGREKRRRSNNHVPTNRDGKSLEIRLDYRRSAAGVRWRLKNCLEWRGNARVGVSGRCVGRSAILGSNLCRRRSFDGRRQCRPSNNISPHCSHRPKPQRLPCHGIMLRDAPAPAVQPEEPADETLPRLPA